MRVRLVGALVTVTVLAGCGGGSSSSGTTAQASTFRGDYTLAIAQFKQTAHGIGAAVVAAPSQSDAKIATTFKALAAQWATDISRLKPLTPPPAIAGEFATLMAAATRTEGDLNAIVLAAQSHNAAAAQHDGASLVKDILAAKAASLTIQHKLGIA